MKLEGSTSTGQRVVFEGRYKYKLKKGLLQILEDDRQANYITSYIREFMLALSEKLINEDEVFFASDTMLEAEFLEKDTYTRLQSYSRGNYEREMFIPRMKTQYVDDVQMTIKVYTRCKLPLWFLDVDYIIPEGFVWGNIRHSTTSFDGNYLKDQIRARYAFYDRPKNGLTNIVMDNYLPKILYSNNFSNSSISALDLPKTIYTISPWFAEIIGANCIATEQLCRVLGFDKKALKTLVNKVKIRNYSISFIGYGGTGVNTIHWLTEIMKFTNSVNLFNFVDIVEPEQLELSNLLRFPKNAAASNGNTLFSNQRSSNWLNETSKLQLLSRAECTLLSKNKLNLSTAYLTENTYMRDVSKGIVLDYDNSRYKTKSNHVLYGAPSMHTRDFFNKLGNFIAATHSGNSCYMWLNPKQDTDLVLETYGLVSLTQFFMNQLRIAIGLLEVLADGVDLSLQDTQLLEYSFDGKAVLPTDKVYNFQLDAHSGNVSTENEAQTNW